MARYLMLHTYDPRFNRSEKGPQIMKAVIDCFTKDTFCIASWMATGAGKIACLWEAPSEQALIDTLPKDFDLPVDGIYPVNVIDWAEIKKTMA